MRPVDEIIVHCTATPRGREVTVDDIRRWHVGGNGWSDIGYHYVIYADGSVHPGRSLEQQGAHCRGHNARSVGIAYVGGLLEDGRTPADTRTDAQKQSLVRLIGSLKKQFPDAVVCGHGDFAAKACPCFDARREYAKLGVLALLLLMCLTGCTASRVAHRDNALVTTDRSVDLSRIADSLSVVFDIRVDSVVSFDNGVETGTKASGIVMTVVAGRVTEDEHLAVKTYSVSSVVTRSPVTAVRNGPPVAVIVALLLLAAISSLVLRLRRHVR